MPTLRSLALSSVLLARVAFAAPPPPTDADLERALAKHHANFVALLHKRGAPTVFQPSVGTSKRVLGALLASWFPAGTSLLFYDQEPESLAVWILDGTGVVASARVPATAEAVEVRATDLRASLGVDDAAHARAPQHRGAMAVVNPHRMPAPALDACVAALSDILLPPPIAEAIARYHRLIVVPTGVIGTVPFALLRLGTGGPPIVETTSVAIAPSLFDLAQTSSIETGAIGKALVVGNPKLDDREWSFPPLPGAAAEAIAVAVRFGTHALVGDAATKAAVIAAAPTADLLYFATHAIASADRPMDDGFLALAGGRWTAREIMATRMRARLAVLSACQTGLGGAVDGGVIGMSRAFEMAGVRRVVMSLWSVDDDATRALMEDFAARLATETPDEALRHAMLTLRRARPSPRQWASFSVFGAPAEFKAGDRTLISLDGKRSIGRLILRRAGGESDVDRRVVDGDTINVVVHSQSGAPARWVTVLFVGADGTTGILSDVDGAASVEVAAGATETKIAQVRIGAPFGLDTYVLVESSAPLAIDRRALDQIHSLAELLADVAARVPVGASWTLSTLAIESAGRR